MPCPREGWLKEDAYGPIIVALLDAWQVNGTTNFYVQIMGLPAAQTSTIYHFPAYNNRTLYSQLRFDMP